MDMVITGKILILVLILSVICLPSFSEDPQGFIGPNDPLFFRSSVSGDLAGVKSELEKGCDVNTEINAGRTALMYASWYGHQEIVKLLVEQGADVNHKSGCLFTPLMCASYMGHLETAKYLVENGADVVAIDDEFKSALYCAREQKHQAVADYLNQLINCGTSWMKNQEIALHDMSGNASAYIDNSGVQSKNKSKPIFLWDGRLVGFLMDAGLLHIYGANGRHLGFLIDGKIFNHQGEIEGFIKGFLFRRTNVETIKNTRKYCEISKAFEKAPQLCRLTENWAVDSLETFLLLGENQIGRQG
ncbi:MAG: ankyrin repeat domain-containing protein [Candidatus Wallbacteria bacterium]|nr:ankyrin repeat domain-containing protein [Candidatus Wallbacteria bacterium]